jgi:DUF35 OB-fold domain, acyl-CoA-associated
MRARACSGDSSPPTSWRQDARRKSAVTNATIATLSSTARTPSRFAMAAKAKSGTRRLHCTGCDADSFDWVETEGTGKVYTFSTVHRAPTPQFASELPYTVGITSPRTCTSSPGSRRRPGVRSRSARPSGCSSRRPGRAAGCRPSRSSADGCRGRPGWAAAKTSVARRDGVLSPQSPCRTA